VKCLQTQVEIVLLEKGSFMEKIDFKKKYKPLYSPSESEVSIIDVPELHYLMVDGKGDPNTSEDFQDAVEALFTLSYALKFKIKKGDLGIDYGVMPLEGLWWHHEMTQFSVDNKEDWHWTLMIMQPEYVTKRILSDVIIQVKMKKDPVALTKVNFEPLFEGKVAQIMHIGPFSDEGPTVAKLHDHIHENGFSLHGKHHEIYLSDIKRAAPENWRTVIRQPIK